MTETREQWIEREAREARERYWGNDNWDRQAEAHKQDWRSVVTPFYQEPVADADTLEKLAEIGENAYNADKSNLIDEKWISATKAILRAAKPEPLRVPVDVDGLAEVVHRAYWQDPAGDIGDGWREAARAVLAYLNIEPCARPEYNPDDVAFRDALKKSQEIVNNWTPEQRNHNSIGYVVLQDNERAELENLRVECKRLRHEVEVERDRANDLLDDRDSAVNIRDKTIKAMREENTKLRVEASEATAKAERQRQQLHSQCKTIESRGAEIARLENEVQQLRIQRSEEKIGCHGCGVTLPKTALEIGYNPVVDGVRVAVCQRCWDAGVGLQGKTAPETRPVRVRFDVTAEDLAAKIHHALHGGWPELSQETDKTKAVWIDTAKIAMDYLAAHAVIDVPPGVPTYRELREIGVNAYLSHDSAKRENAGCMVDPMGSAAAAIRDAVLAGIQRREWTEQDVEELAGILRREAGWTDTEWEESSLALKEALRKQARAALAWLDGKRGG